MAVLSQHHFTFLRCSSWHVARALGSVHESADNVEALGGLAQGKLHIMCPILPASPKHVLSNQLPAALHLCSTVVGSLNGICARAQLRDTCDLFCFKRQRRLSLRFLASYLLGLDIQAATHDSIEDARTALQLFQLYERLAADGSLQARLLEMYRWGKAHGWCALRVPARLTWPPQLA